MDENLEEAGSKMIEEWASITRGLEARKADLVGEDMSNMKLLSANFSEGNLSEADLSCAYLIRSNLSGANLTGADLTDTVLSESNLTGADFKEAELNNTWLNGSDLSGARNLTADQVEFANIDKETVLPDYIKVTWTSDTTFECSD